MMSARGTLVQARFLLATVAALTASMMLGCTSSGDGGAGGTDDFLNRGAQVSSDTTAALEYVRLEKVSGDRDSACIGVEAIRAFNVFNASFTLSYDPGVLRYTSFDPAGTCIGSGAEVLPPLVDATTTPGNVVVGLSRNGAITSTGVDCGQLITLCFDVIGDGDTRLTFTGNRQLQDPTGTPVAMQWLGADLTTRL